MQPQQAPPAPLDMDKYLQSLNQKLSNMKRQNAQQLGILVQTQSEQIGRQHDGLVQEIAPLIQEVGRLLQEVEELKKQIPKKEEKKLPDTSGIGERGTVKKAEMQPQAPKIEKK